MSVRPRKRVALGYDVKSHWRRYLPGTLVIIMKRQIRYLNQKLINGQNSIINTHLYPFNLNSYNASPIFLSETTPRGHAPRTACKIAGVECNGGFMTRKSVADGNERAKGTLLTALSAVKLERLLAEPFGSGDGGTDPEAGDKEAGFEKAMANLSSCSRP